MELGFYENTVAEASVVAVSSLLDGDNPVDGRWPSNVLYHCSNHRMCQKSKTADLIGPQIVVRWFKTMNNDGENYLLSTVIYAENERRGLCLSTSNEIEDKKEQWNEAPPRIRKKGI